MKHASRRPREGKTVAKGTRVLHLARLIGGRCRDRKQLLGRARGHMLADQGRRKQKKKKNASRETCFLLSRGRETTTTAGKRCAKRRGRVRRASSLGGQMPPGVTREGHASCASYQTARQFDPLTLPFRASHPRCLILARRHGIVCSFPLMNRESYGHWI